jgi:capsular polysaccharide biosynthesis protein
MTTTERPIFSADDLPDDLPLPAPGRPRKAERVPVLRAVREHWVLAIAPAAFFVFLAIVAGMARNPTYTSESRVNVGRIDVSSQSIPGFVASIQALAATYSHAVNAQAVLQPVADKLHTTPNALAGRVGASPIPDSPLFRVTATGSTPTNAVELANLVTASLASYVSQLNSSNPEAAQTLRDIDSASVALAQARARLRAAQATYARVPSSANNQLVTERNADVYSANLRLQTLSDAYRQSQQGLAQSQIIQVLNPASTASSDKRSVLQKLVFVALLGGIAAGFALATARANWRPRRRPA